MVNISNEQLITNDIGRVIEVDAPKGVSWVSFGGLVLCGYDENCNDADGYFDVVPVSTEELEGAKGAVVAVDDCFLAQINLSATSQADVHPCKINYAPPVSDEEFDIWGEEKIKENNEYGKDF